LCLKKAKPPTLQTFGGFCFHPLKNAREGTFLKYSKGILKLNNEGLELQTALSPWLRCCIGLAIVMLATVPVLYVIRWW